MGERVMNREMFSKRVRDMEFWGAHSPSSAGDGASPSRTWFGMQGRDVRCGEGAAADTRGAYAPQTQISTMKRFR